MEEKDILSDVKPLKEERSYDRPYPRRDSNGPTGRPPRNFDRDSRGSRAKSSARPPRRDGNSPAPRAAGTAESGGTSHPHPRRHGGTATPGRTIDAHKVADDLISRSLETRRAEMVVLIEQAVDIRVRRELREEEAELHATLTRMGSRERHNIARRREILMRVQDKTKIEPIGGYCRTRAGNWSKNQKALEESFF